MMIPKRITAPVTNYDMELFASAMRSGVQEAGEFVQNYIEGHQQRELLDVEDVYSLFLIKAVVSSNIEVIKNILSQSYVTNILVHLDNSGDSPIYTALSYNNQEMLILIETYIAKEGGKIDKAEMDDEYLLMMHSAFECTMLKKTYLDIYVKPIYTHASVEKLIEILGGEDHIYDVTY